MSSRFTSANNPGLRGQERMKELAAEARVSPIPVKTDLVVRENRAETPRNFADVIIRSHRRKLAAPQ
ncbi:hypothetical protein [Bradyrhizobium sp. LTSPM299]|uniref:hypothetical protein n=1 Tax=Bradyrhizobium sp. LTSPM299 TaxID=1619233 RepID=UPI000AD7AAC7|nr:hypothetical protein [Bradyrhizobium sp. LTSPM299]